jgi:hypothetical protein
MKLPKSVYSGKELKGQIVRQHKWQRVILLCIIGYEAAGALSGGSLLIAVPDGRLMDMPVNIMHGFFRDFLIPGLMLLGLGFLNTAGFFAVLFRFRSDWVLAGLALGGLAVWFTVEIIILQELHWLHIMWGLPVVFGILLIIPMVSSKFRRLPVIYSDAVHDTLQKET